MINFILWDTVNKKELAVSGVSHPSQLYTAPEGSQWVVIGHDIKDYTIEINDTGDFIEVLRAVPLPLAQQQAITAINTKRDFYLSYSITSIGTVDSDEKSLAAITAMIGLINAGIQTANIEWRLHDNSFATISCENFKTFAQEVVANRTAVMKKSWDLKAEILAAITSEAALAIVWTV